MADESGFDPVAFFIGGGAEHSPELMRLLPYSFFGDREGIVTPGDLKVTQTNVASSRVRMAPGAAVMLNRYVSNPRESYLVRAPRESFIEIPQTNASGPRTDLIGVRVDDPQYEGVADPPSEEAARFWEYAKPFRIPNVNPSIRSVAELNLGYAAYGCSLVNMPANTATVEDGFITELRQLVRPSSDDWLDVRSFEPGIGGIANATVYAGFPTWYPRFTIPKWATEIRVVATMSGIGVINAPAEGTMHGTLRLPGQAPFLTSPDVSFDFDAGAASNGERSTFMVVVGGSVPVQYRGKEVEFRAEARRDPVAAGYLDASRSNVNMSVDARFYERIV